MASLLSRKFKKKSHFQIDLKLIKISAPHIDQEIDFVDLAVVWKRGPQQDETHNGPGLYKGYELNHIEVDCHMDHRNPSREAEVFQRVSGFYQDGKGNWDKKFCHFQIKHYEYDLADNSKRIDQGKIIGELQYNMSENITCEPDTIRTVEIATKSWLIGPVTLEFTMLIRETENSINAEAFNKK